MFAAVLDTSVLWPSLQRDFLLSLAAEGSYRPLWSRAILDELVFHEAQKLIKRKLPKDVAQLSAQRLIAQMAFAFNDSLVTDWESLEGSYGLPDPDDEHVVAAAVVGDAEVIVTENLKDFPATRLPSSLRAISAREFVFDTVQQHVTEACRAVLEICARSGRHGPKVNVQELLNILATRYGMTDTAKLLWNSPALRHS